VGEKRAALYAKLRIFTVRDLLRHFPRDYIDLCAPHSIMGAPVHETCAIRARLVEKGREQRIRKGLSIFKLLAVDDSGEMQITMFNAKYTVDSLKLDCEYIFYGQTGGGLLRREMASPRIFPSDGEHSILPVYPQTAGVNSNLMRKNIRQALDAPGALRTTSASSTPAFPRYTSPKASTPPYSHGNALSLRSF
jgi:ATP-dependent DNA helicase RecG